MKASAENSLTTYRPILASMYVQDGVLLYQDRVIVPPSLRQQVLHHLHACCSPGNVTDGTASSRDCVLTGNVK